jgi:hypothetical protein
MDGGSREDQAAELYDDFKLVVHDVKERAKWHARSKDENLDRNAEAVQAWNKLETFGDEIEKQYHSLVYHRLWLFDWLLRRYDVRRARSVVGGGWWARNAHLLLLFLVMLVYVARRLGLFGNHETLLTLFCCAGTYAAVLFVLARSFKAKLPERREAFAVATHSLIPRLAAAAVVGVLFLASSLELLLVVLDTRVLWLPVLLLAVYGYIFLEMSRRVHPLPPLRRLALHALDISATALAHSFTLTLLAEGVLRKLLEIRGSSRLLFGWSESFSLVVFVFSIGLVVNLIWAEQPVTEPL